MKQFCVSKFEIRNPKEKREECSFCLCFIATMREAHVFLVDFYENLAYTKLCNDFIFYMFEIIFIRKQKVGLSLLFHFGTI